MTDPTSPAGRTRVLVCMGTYRRNDALRTLLRSVVVAAEKVHDLAAVGVVVVDDNPDGAAKVIADEFADGYELGLHYRSVGRGNISLVRNEILDAGSELGDWIAMTDDDCQASPDWLRHLIVTQRRWDADCVTGRDIGRAPQGAPRWLVEQPFLSDGPGEYHDQQEMHLAHTSNVLLSTAWVREHPEVRFRPDLGVVGGEDMVFFATAWQAGLHIRYSLDAVMYADLVPERATFPSRLRASYWLGNTESITNLQLGAATPARLMLRAGRSGLRAVARPAVQAAHRRPPQVRYATAQVARAIGRGTGAIGWKARHH